MSTRPAERLRQPPSQRFATSEDVIDLKQAAQRLVRQSSDTQGHRQMTLFKQGPATLALFLFDEGARLADHVVDGPVIIHVLAGRVKVATDAATHELAEGTLLRLAPKVRHDLEATEPSQVLMTMCLEGPDSGRDAVQ